MKLKGGIMLAVAVLLSVAVLLTACNKDGENAYKVVFMDGDEVVYTRDVLPNTAVLYTPEQEAGRTFLGWFTDPELTVPFDGSQGITSDMTVYGKWKVEQFTVTFVDSDGNVISEQTVDYGDSAVPPAADEIPDKDGYSFSGWSGSYDNVTSDLVLTAEYEKIPYIGKVSFLVNGESVLTVEDVAEGERLARYFDQANAAVQLPDYVAFDSVWQDDSGKTVTSDAVFGDKDLVLNAVLALSDSLKVEKYDGYTAGTTAGNASNADFDYTLVYNENIFAILGYVLVGTAYKDVAYDLKWYYNGAEITDFGATAEEGRYFSAHNFDFTASDSLTYTNVGVQGENTGNLNLNERLTLDVGEYDGLFSLVMTARVQDGAYADLDSYTSEIAWDFKIDPATFSVGYVSTFKSVTYDGEAVVFDAAKVFPELPEGDTAKFSVDGVNYVEELSLKDAGLYFIDFRVSRKNYCDFTNTVTFEIVKKPITVYAEKPSDKIFYYGDLPDYTGFGYRTDGLAAGDALDMSDARFTGLPDKFGSAGQEYVVYIDSGVSHKNYDITYSADKAADGCNLIVVEKRPVSITVAATEAVYGASLPTFTPILAEGSAFAPNEGFGNLVAPCAFAIKGANGEVLNVGSYKVTPDYSNYKGNYDITAVPGVLTITPAPLTGIIQNAETPYYAKYDSSKFTVVFPTLIGNAEEILYLKSNYDYSYSVSGYDHTTAAAGTSFTVEGTAEANITNANYIVTLKAGTLTVDRRDITVYVEPGSTDSTEYVYGASASDIIKGFDSRVYFPEDLSKLTNGIELTTDYVDGMGVGNYFVTARVKADAENGVYDNYRLSFEKVGISIVKRNIEVALKTEYEYGDEFDGSYSLPANPMAFNDSLELTFDTKYSAGKPVGNYSVNIAAKVNGSESTDNYTISLSNGTITVSPRSVTLTLTSTARMVVGEAWTGEITAADNLFQGDSVSAKIGLSVAAAGTYTYSETAAEDWTVETRFLNANDEDVTANYAAGYAVTVTILSVTIEHTLKPDFPAEYPADVFDFTVTYDGGEHYVSVVLDETVTGDYSVAYSLSENGEYTDTVPVFTNPGFYTVYYRLSPKSGTGAVEKGSYTLTILKQQLSLELKDREIVYGEAFVYGEVSGIPVDCTVSASGYTPGSDVGNYLLTAALTENSENYELVYTEAFLTVLAKPVTVTVANAEVVYGEDATLTYTANGLFVNDKLYLYSDYSAGKGVGEYPISIRPDDNYDIDYNEAVVRVSQKPLNVFISDVTIEYGDAEPDKYDYTVTGLAAGDEPSLLKIITDYDPSKGVGKYKITVDKNSLLNYTVPEGSAGTLFVKPKDVSVRWTEVQGEFVYNGEVQAVSVTADVLQQPYGGAIDAETLDDIIKNIKLTYSKDGVPTEFKNAGTYTVTVDLGENFNLWNPQFDFVIEKAEYTLSEEKIITTYRHNQTLSQIVAPKDLSWLNPNEVPVPSKTEYAATVTNDNYYSEELISVTITVKKAEVVPTSVYTMEYTSGQVVIPDVIPAYYAEDSSVEIPRGTVSFVYDVDSFVPGTYAVTANLSENEYYSMAAATVYVKVAAVTLNGVKYTLEDALYNARSGNTITLLGNVDLAFTADEAIINAIYADAAYRTLKAGVTLILPSTDDAAGIGETTYLNRTELRYIDGIDSYINMKLTIPAGVEFIVNGSILVRGGLGNVTTGTNGHTTGNHSQIVNNGTVTAKSGAILDMKGFIKGVGTLYMESGSDLYSPFAVLDYRGGTNTVIAYKTGKIAPFRIFDIPNVQCKVIYEYGSELKAYFDLYANSSHNYMDEPVTIIGPSGGVGAIFNMQPGSVIEVLTEKHAYKEISLMTSAKGSGGWATNDRHTLLLKGNIDIGSLKLEIKLSFISATVDMNEVLFPIPYLYDIIIGDGTTATTVNANARYKFMPGSALTVNKNATLNMGGELIFYHEGYADDLTGFTGQTAYYKYPTALKNKAAILTLNGGTLNVTGTLAANVNATEGGKLIMAAGAGNYLESKEGHSGSSSSADAIQAGLFGSGGEMTMQTVAVTGTLNDGTAISGGVTYTYSGGVWSYR